MPNYSAGLQGLVSGGLEGATFGPEVAIPLALTEGAIGLFSQTDEEQRNKRIQDYINSLSQQERDELGLADYNATTQIGRVNKATTGEVKRSNADVGRNLASIGRKATAGDLLAPQGKIISAGGNSIQNLLEQQATQRMDITKRYNSLISGANYEKAAQPLEPTIADTLQSLAGPVSTYFQNKQYMDILKKNQGGLPGGSSGTTKGNGFGTPPYGSYQNNSIFNSPGLDTNWGVPNFSSAQNF